MKPGRQGLLALLSVCLAVTSGCGVKVPAECSSDRDCTGGGACMSGFCVVATADAGGTVDAGTFRPDAGAAAPGSAWQAATCGGAFGDTAMAGAHHSVIGAMCEPTPAIEAGATVMQSTSHRVIGGFNAALHSK